MYTVILKDNKTGQSKRIEMTGEFDRKEWEDGRYSCDCIKHDIFLSRNSIYAFQGCGKDRYILINYKGKLNES